MTREFSFILVVTKLFLATVVSSVSSASAEYSVWPNHVTINEDWLYLERASTTVPGEHESGFVPVKLPHTWNGIDTLMGEKYRRDSSWYRKQLLVAAGQLSRRHFLRFGAAGQEAKVFVNGQLVGEHVGGYAAFTFEITKQLTVGKNQVDVWVSNVENLDLSPIDADFNFYGGLYRSVQLLQAPLVCLSRTHHGGPGVRVWSEDVRQDVADLNVTVAVDVGTEPAGRLRVVAELFDPAGRVVSRGETSHDFQNDEVVQVSMPKVTTPSLWSPETPRLYSLRVRLFDGSLRLDQATVRHGFRWYKFLNNGDFFLNGELYDLRGVNRHQDLEGFGNAVSAEHHLRDIGLIKELGANWLRLAHYQQDDYVLELCDQLGLLVWEEFPFVNVLTDTKAFRDNNELMLREMIHQHHNHPSIIMWGVQNEILLKQERQFHDEKVAMVKHLVSVAREEDPRRVIVQAGHGITRYGEIGLTGLADVMGYNVYYGWYGGDPEHLTLNMEELRQLQPDRPHVVSEYGAGSDIRIHVDKPRSQDFSEEWQVHFLESYLDQFADMPICGTLWWNMFDFGVSRRGDSIPHVNQKGLIGFDHETKKDVWYLMKSRWSEDPVLYLVSPRFLTRSGDPTKTYRVFTNFDEVELFHQGRSLGRQGEKFTWDVELEPGENRLLARGRRGDLQDEHGFVVSYSEEDNSNTDAQEPAIMAAATLKEDGWKLVWGDEFDYSGLPDPEKWQLEKGFIRNNELQYYTLGRSKNARVENGHLVIEGHREPFPNAEFKAGAKEWQKARETAEYTSACVTSKNRKEFCCGRVDVRAKLPRGRGVWPAIWMLGAGHPEHRWPLCGEADIMEYVGHRPGIAWSAVHTEKFNWTKQTQKKHVHSIAEHEDEFHLYSMCWYPDRLEFFIDGKGHMAFANDGTGAEAWPFDKPFFLLLNFAIGGGLGGQKGVDEAIFPQQFLIDYVRLYEQE